VFGIDRLHPDGPNQTEPLNVSCYDDRVLGYGGICPVANYCPVGSVYPIPCDNGTYADVQGLEACLTCPAGMKYGFCTIVLVSANI